MVKSAHGNDIFTMNDDELVSGCRNGDTQCQRALFKKYRESIYNIIVHSLGVGYEKDDIFQQVFIKIFKSLHYFKGLSSLDTWVYRITTKVCVDQLRKKYRKRQIDLVNSSEYIDTYKDTKGKNPQGKNEQNELIEHIYEGLGKLSIEKRMVVTMFEIEGFSLQDISEILKKPLGTVKSRLFHGRKELAGYLRSYMDAR